MNANELIKRMEDGYSVSYDEIIAMLRQFDLAESIIKQQELQIEALKAENKSLIAELQQWEDDYDEPYKEARPWTPEEANYLRKWAIEGDLKNAKTLLEQAGYKVQEPKK